MCPVFPCSIYVSIFTSCMPSMILRPRRWVWMATGSAVVRCRWCENGLKGVTSLICLLYSRQRHIKSDVGTNSIISVLIGVMCEEISRDMMIIFWTTAFEFECIWKNVGCTFCRTCFTSKYPSPTNYFRSMFFLPCDGPRCPNLWYLFAAMAPSIWLFRSFDFLCLRGSNRKFRFPIRSKWKKSRCFRKMLRWRPSYLTSLLLWKWFHSITRYSALDGAHGVLNIERSKSSDEQSFSSICSASCVFRSFRGFSYS